MNVGECRDFIRGQLDFQPQQTPYADHVLRCLNLSLLALYADVPWPWAQTELVQQVYADVTTTAGTATAGAHNVTTAGAFFETWMVNQLLIINSVEYTIVRVASGTSAYIGIHYASTTGTKTFVAAMRNIQLPEDCVAVMHIGMRKVSTTGNMDFLSLNRTDADTLRLRQDQTGTPTAWVPADNYRIPAPAVAPPMTTAATTPWVAGTYTFVSTHERGGYHSAPSPVSTLTLTGTTNPVVTFPTIAAASGYTRYLWMKYEYPTGVSYPKYRQILAGVSETGGAFSLSALEPAANWQFNDALPYTEGQVRRYSLYPRQAADLQVQVRYLSRPARLVEDTDELPTPVEASMWICYNTIVQLAVPKGDKTLSAMYQKQADDAMTALRRRHLTEIQRTIQLGLGWGSGNNRGNYRMGAIGPVYSV